MNALSRGLANHGMTAVGMEQGYVKSITKGDTTLAELGVEEDDIEKMLPTLAQNKGVPFGSFKKLTLEDAAEIYRLAL